MKPLFKYYIRPPLDMGGYYTADTNGTVSISPNPTPLEYSPIEWDNTDIKFTRNVKAFGVFRSLALPMTFVYDGAAILRYIYYTQGTEGEANFRVELLNTTNDLHEPFYPGSINFASAKDERDTFEVGIEDNELAAKLKAAEDTPFEIAILDSDSVSILLDGVRLRNKVRYSIVSIMQARSVNARTASPDMIRNLSESEVIFDVKSDTTLDTADIPTLTQTNNFYEASLDGVVRVTFEGRYLSIPASGTDTTPYTFKMAVVRRRGSTLDYFELYSDSSSFLAKQMDINDFVGIVVEPGDTLTLVTYVESIDSADRYYFDTTNGVLTISYDFRLDPSTTRGYRYIDVIRKLVNQISPGATVESEYLTNTARLDWDTNAYNAILTCGESLRRIGEGDSTTTAPKLVVKWEDIRQDLLGRFWLGYGIEGNTVRIEPVDYFFNPDSISLEDLGEIDDLTVQPYTEFIARDFIFGQDKEDYDDLNGREEYNTTQTFTSGAVRTKEVGDYKYVFRSDISGIEETRYVLEDKETTDSKSDNEVFCIEISKVKEGDDWTLYRPQNDTNGFISGVLAAETAYNLGYTPKRCFNRIAPLVAVSMWNRLDETLTFQTSDKNDNLESRLGDNPVLVVEKADVPAASLPDPVFLPLVSTFKVQTPLRLSTFAAQNPYGLVYWRNKNVLQWGFIEEIGEHPSDNSAYSFNIIMAKGSPVGPNNIPT